MLDSDFFGRLTHAQPPGRRPNSLIALEVLPTGRPAGPKHPLVRRHPETGRLALYLGRRRVYPSQFIEDLEEAASEALLEKLWAHASCEELSWTLVGRPGDFLVCDNRAAMHYCE
jgi:taurine dioxygenase